MIELFYDMTPNGRKILVALEELGLDYEVHWVDLKNGEQLTPEFRAVNPNAKIPAIIDRSTPDGAPITLFESGAILLYLAEKAGALLPTEPRARWEAICWTFWQVANQGPASGNAAHFTQYAPSAGIVDEYATTRFVTETRRCAQVLNDQLQGHEFVVGDEFTVADIACFPWTRVMKGYGIDINDYAALAAWSARVAARPASKIKAAKPEQASAPGRRVQGDDFAKLFGVDPTAFAEQP